MSWFTIAAGHLTDDDKIKLRAIHPDGAYVLHEKNVWVIAGGIKETTHKDESCSADSGGILCGLPVERRGDGYVLTDVSAPVSAILSELQDGKFDGIFAGAAWDHHTLTFFNDRLGLRDLYYQQIRDKIIISTSPLWAACLSPRREIDFSHFGSRWLLFSQIGIRALLKGVTRLQPGEVVSVSRAANTISTCADRWTPTVDADSNACEKFVDALLRVLRFPADNGLDVSLGLSGGLDSRLLLSLYLRSSDIDRRLFQVHTFGNPRHPDGVVAHKISSKLNINHRIFFEPLPQKDSAIEMLKDFTFHTMAGRRASSILQLHYYSNFSKTTIVVDGAFGELYRRQFLNRLLRRGKQNILQKEGRGIYNNLAVFRADFFNQDINNDLAAGALTDINELMDELPAPSEFGLEHWVDLFAIRSILPNVVAYEQARVDLSVRSIMPFLFTSVLDTLFSIPLSQRRKGRLFRKILRESNRELTKFPLVRSDVSYPFSFSALPSYIWMKGKQKLKLNFRDTQPREFLMELKDYVNDLYLSRDARECGVYDQNKLRNIVEGFYNGDESKLSQLDWWLAFELWRKQL